MFIGAFQVLMIVIEADVEWPGGWFDFLSDFQFITLFSLDIAFTFAGVGNGFAFLGTRMAQPVLLIYAYWSSSF